MTYTGCVLRTDVNKGIEMVHAAYAVQYHKIGGAGLWNRIASDNSIILYKPVDL
jgi:hypothetical protein